jgi:peptide-methionine (S)-S-oxide reductase
MTSQMERAVLAGGCFWGMQDLIRKMPGVLSTRVGYSGGEVVNATYRHHGTHAEAIEIVFDPKIVSYRTLLEFFFQIHDPTTRNRQGNDVGMSYRSAIFYVNDAQKRIAKDTIADVEASGLWPGKVVTELAPAGPFWEAETRASGLSRAIPRRLHLPLRPTRLETSAPRRGEGRLERSRGRTPKATLFGSADGSRLRPRSTRVCAMRAALYAPPLVGGSPATAAALVERPLPLPRDPRKRLASEGGSPVPRLRPRRCPPPRR